MRIGRLLVSAALLPASFAIPAVAREPAAPVVPVDYDHDVRPILSNHCYKCHGPDPEKREAGLRLDLKDEAFKLLESGNFAIVPGKPDESQLAVRVGTREADAQMPPPDTGRKLTRPQIDLLRRWVAEGAVWKPHWAYAKPQRPDPPPVKNAAWPRNPIDRFVLARLEKEGLAPSPEASRETLLRRASLDLIGLPPAPAEIDAFVSDPAPDAYERAVDRLLASPHYGERWARPWLDAARYADTNGYEKDLIRTMWPWRDWVIAALNRNLPFDEFTIEQLAGDLLPPGPAGAGDPEEDPVVATGFHRNSMLNDEGGVFEEEFRVAAIIDRIDVTATTWLGTTMACAQCHSHKFDPIANIDYYRFFAFFNSTADSAVKPDPQAPVPSAEQRASLEGIRKSIADLEAQRKAAEADLPAAQARWEAGVKAKTETLPPLPEEGLVAHYPFDEIDGPGAAESGGRTPPAVFKGLGKPGRVPGRLGFAAELDGRGGYFDAGPVADFERTEAFSYGGWVDFAGKDGAILTHMDDGAAYRGFDLIAVGGKIEIHLVHRWPDNAVKVSARDPLPNNTWFHLMVVYDGSSKAAGVTLYVDGAPRPLEVKQDALTDTIRTAVPVHVGLRHFSLPYSGRVDDVRIYRRALTADEVGRLASAPAAAVLDVPPDRRTDAQKAELAAYYRDRHATGLMRLRDAVAAKKKEETDLQAKVPKMMVMKDLPQPRESHVLIRGQWDRPGDRVEPGVPESIFPLPPELKQGPMNRLTLARWIVHPDHPLTSRVIVNRCWRELFGRGLVETVEDFGMQGERPSHPDLLDWLATEFVGRKWDMKALLKTIVLSATYRQSSATTPERLERDPQNRLFTRGPRFRCEAETIRDIALAASGLLNPAIGGPSVYPPQPPGIWENSFSFYDTKDRWVDETGPNRYRRGLYTFWRRSAPYPTALTFDVTSRDVCCVKRYRTNTPLQALDTLNNPVFVECSAGLARRALREGGVDDAARLAHAFRLCTGRRPKAEEQGRLLALLARARERYGKDEPAARETLAAGRLDPGDLDPKDLAAWTVVANAILNLDETLTKG